jgi:hypothetical protein
MIQIDFTEAEIDALEYERSHHPLPHVQKRMEIVYLKSQGILHQDIARLCRVARQTVVTTLHLYVDGGIERLKQFHFAGQPSALNDHQSTMEAHFRAHPPQTVAEAQADIERSLPHISAENWPDSGQYTARDVGRPNLVLIYANDIQPCHTTGLPNGESSLAS